MAYDTARLTTATMPAQIHMPVSVMRSTWSSSTRLTAAHTAGRAMTFVAGPACALVGACARGGLRHRGGGAAVPLGNPDTLKYETSESTVSSTVRDEFS